jgi:hypothetical protein
MDAQTTQDITALGHSVIVIDDVLALDTPDEEQLDALDRNVRHIEIMLAKEHIIDSGADLTEFESAVERGREALALVGG